MSKVKAKFIQRTALVIQMISFCILLVTGFSSSASAVAFFAAIGAGIAEVVLALRAKRQNALTG
jgi:hypothetical protein